MTAPTANTKCPTNRTWSYTTKARSSGSHRRSTKVPARSTWSTSRSTSNSARWSSARGPSTGTRWSSAGTKVNRRSTWATTCPAEPGTSSNAPVNWNTAGTRRRRWTNPRSRTPCGSDARPCSTRSIWSSLASSYRSSASVCSSCQRMQERRWQCASPSSSPWSSSYSSSRKFSLRPRWQSRWLQNTCCLPLSWTSSPSSSPSSSSTGTSGHHGLTGCRPGSAGCSSTSCLGWSWCSGRSSAIAAPACSGISSSSRGTIDRRRCSAGGWRTTANHRRQLIAVGRWRTSCGGVTETEVAWAEEELGRWGASAVASTCRVAVGLVRASWWRMEGVGNSRWRATRPRRSERSSSSRLIWRTRTIMQT